MNNVNKTLCEQMKITELDIKNRKTLFLISDNDVQRLKAAKSAIEQELDALVEEFYQSQTDIPEIALLISDSDTLERLHSAQKNYILDLFSGYYDMEYVNNRLRIGLVHKRIGVEPKLYLAAIQTLEQTLIKVIKKAIPHFDTQEAIIDATKKLIMFDTSLVFDTYIRSLITEIELAKTKTEKYAESLEKQIKERTQELELMSKTDPMTGLLNRQHFDEYLTRALRAAQRRNEPLTMAYVDIDNFKMVNDTHGHLKGDEVIQKVAQVIKANSRIEDLCFRYGGDEFCIIITNCQESDAQRIWGRRVIKQLAAYENGIQVSIGYAQTGADHYVSGTELLQQADKNMYIVKQQMKSIFGKTPIKIKCSSTSTNLPISGKSSTRSHQPS